jgi:hypothetical protein
MADKPSEQAAYFESSSNELKIAGYKWRKKFELDQCWGQSQD